MSKKQSKYIWQKHPSTLTNHAFKDDAKPGDGSICGRAFLTTARSIPKGNHFCCVRCLDKAGLTQ